MLGLSSTTWSGGALPLDLTGLGMPGCLLRVAPDLLTVLPAVGSTAPWTLQLPANAAFLGWSLVAQGAAFDPPANAFGVVVGNALELRLGGI